MARGKVPTREPGPPQYTTRFAVSFEGHSAGLGLFEKIAKPVARALRGRMV